MLQIISAIFIGYLFGCFQTSYFISKISGFRIKDSQCGFRMYRNSLLEKISFQEKGFQFESEVLLKIPKETKIGQIPINLIYNNIDNYIIVFLHAQCISITH